ncbi:MAG: hypothetical protein LBU28_02340 [Spirochaetaceae bacterium]|nr:hypothetical protein [Spirochaetaceae bacterium]
MKNTARLFCFFSLFFLGAFLAIAALRGFNACIDGSLLIPAIAASFRHETVSAARSIIPLALYTALLFSLSYAARRHIPVLAASLVLWAAALALTLGLFLGIERLSALSAPPAASRGTATLGKPGLILSGDRRAVILLENPGKAGGSRVAAEPGRSLIHRRALETGDAPLPPAPFNREKSSLLDDLLLDGSRRADWLSRLLGYGLFPFLLYTGSLIFLLVSLCFVLNLSDWPLANLFIGALIFREVLSFEGFISLQEVRDLIRSFIGDSLPELLLSPLIFCALGLLFTVYTLLVFLARGPRTAENGTGGFP